MEHFWLLAPVHPAYNYWFKSTQVQGYFFVPDISFQGFTLTTSRQWLDKHIFRNEFCFSSNCFIGSFILKGFFPCMITLIYAPKTQRKELNAPNRKIRVPIAVYSVELWRWQFIIKMLFWKFSFSGKPGNQSGRDGSQGGHSSGLLVRISDKKIFGKIRENLSKFNWKYFAKIEKCLEELLLRLVWPWKPAEHDAIVGMRVVLTWYIYATLTVIIVLLLS